MSAVDPRNLQEARRLLDEGKVSSLELTEAAIDRAKECGNALNAFIAIEEEEALDAARKADAARAARQPLGPLAGIPLAHKDMFDRSGRITGCGSKIRADNRATQTATVMARLEAAGALSIGRLNMSEFAMGPTGHNHHYGRAINPVDPARITGGSSSGSGAAVGGGVVLAALGSDTGGSIRLPAACCGTVGIKPTQGRVSRHGAMGLSFAQDCIGPLARTVDDAMLVLRLIAGPDGHDMTVVDTPPLEPVLPAVDALKIGFADTFFSEGLADPVAGAVETCRRLLEGKADAVSTVPIPDLQAVGELANVVAMSEAAGIHFDWLRARAGDYGPQVGARLSQGLAVPAPLYLRALQIRARLLAEFLDTVFSACDILIVPVMPFLPPMASDVDVGAGSGMNHMLADMTRFTRPFSFLGLPVVTLPVASEGGLPVAVQVVAPPFGEGAAAGVAAFLERCLNLPAFTPLSSVTTPMQVTSASKTAEVAL